MSGSFTQQQPVPQTANTSNSCSITLTGVAVGAMLVLSVGTWNHTGGVGLVSGGGAAWTNRVNVGQGSGVNGAEEWEGLNSSGGSVTITWTRGGGVTSPDISVCLSEFGGMPTSATFDVAASTTGSGTAADSGLTGTTAQADSLSCSVCCNSDANTTMVSLVADAYTDLNAITNGLSFAVIRPAYKILSATGTQQGRFTIGTSTNWAAGVAVYKAAVSGGASMGAAVMAATAAMPSADLLGQSSLPGTWIGQRVGGLRYG